jgi:SPW repeat
MLEITWKKETVSDVANVLLGAFLFLTPWFYGYASEATASWNAWVSGIVVAGLAVAALAAYAEWEEWLNLLVGLWVAVSPWLVGFSANATAMRLHLAVGALVALVAAVRLWFAHHTVYRITP